MSEWRRNEGNRRAVKDDRRTERTGELTTNRSTSCVSPCPTLSLRSGSLSVPFTHLTFTSATRDTEGMRHEARRWTEEQGGVEGQDGYCLTFSTLLRFLSQLPSCPSARLVSLRSARVTRVHDGGRRTKHEDGTRRMWTERRVEPRTWDRRDETRE